MQLLAALHASVDAHIPTCHVLHHADCRGASTITALTPACAHIYTRAKSRVVRQLVAAAEIQVEIDEADPPPTRGRGDATVRDTSTISRVANDTATASIVTTEHANAATVGATAATTIERLAARQQLQAMNHGLLACEAVRERQVQLLH